jgi:hypothetical protein
MTERLLLFLFLTLIVLSCTRCKEECTDSTNADCPNYVAPPTPVDPCAGSSEVSAEFTVEARVSTVPIAWRHTIGAYDAQLIRVSAVQDGLDYKWVVGTDTIYTRTHTFYFPNGSEGQSYPITLIVAGSIDSICHPYDNGMDTVVKYIPVVDSCSNPIFGQYRIAFDNSPLDSFDVELGCPTSFSYSYLIAHNFEHDEDGSSCFADIQAMGYNYYRLYSDAISCKRMRGEVWLNEDGSFEAEYQINVNPPGPNVNMQTKNAKGRRIN